MASLPFQAGPDKGRDPFAHTFSIIAYDPKTGEIGGAVQSHWFAVGSVVLWGEAGLGMVATQSFTNPSYGPRGLTLLRDGLMPRWVVERMTLEDGGREVRQVAVMDAQGKAAAFTGNRCVPHAGHQVGKNYSVQANMMLSEEVWPAMARAFESAEGPLADRLMASLDAAQAAGGDFRGMQSAALLVFSGSPTGKIWQDRKVDIRVDDSKEPLVELRRLLRLHQGYELLDEGENELVQGRTESAVAKYTAAGELLSDNEEMIFWQAAFLSGAGKFEEAIPLFRKVFAINPNWRTFTPDLVRLGHVKMKDSELERLMNM
jgi:uncharacterized Ntn-hydrolase superfamily protein